MSEQTRQQLWDLMVSELHERAGLCGCCGKKKCAGRQSHSTLPAKLSTDDVLAAMNLILEPNP